MRRRPNERIKDALFSPAGFVAVLTVLICIGAILLVQMYGKAYRAGGYDLTGYLKATANFAHGGNPYETDTQFPFIYPLFACIVMIPFYLAPYWLSNLAWFAVNASAIFLSSLYFLRMLLPSCTPRQSVVLTFVPLLVTLNIMQSNFLNGQINPAVILFCVLFLHALLRDRRLLAGALLAAAISMKLTPLIFLVYLIFRKEFRTIAWTILFSCIFIVVLPYFFVGPRLTEYYEYYFHTFFSAKLSSGPASGEHGFSLASFLRIAFRDASGLALFALASVLTLIPAGLLQIRLGRRQQSPPVAALLMLLYMVSILLISPMSETHHMAFLLLAAVFMMTTALLGNRRSDFQFGALSLLGMSCGIVLGKFAFSGYALAIAVCYGSIYIGTLREASEGLSPRFASPPPARDQ